MPAMLETDTLRGPLLKRVAAADGKIEVGRLLSEVAHDTGIDIPLVTAAMWDLVDQGELSYGTDAMVRDLAPAR